MDHIGEILRLCPGREVQMTVIVPPGNELGPFLDGIPTKGLHSLTVLAHEFSATSEIEDALDSVFERWSTPNPPLRPRCPPMGACTITRDSEFLTFVRAVSIDLASALWTSCGDPEPGSQIAKLELDNVTAPTIKQVPLHFPHLSALSCGANTNLDFLPHIVAPSLRKLTVCGEQTEQARVT